MNDTNPQPTAPSARPLKYFFLFATLMLVIPALGLLYVGVAHLYPPLQADAAIFAALQFAPTWLRIEWYGAVLIGLFALSAVGKGALSGLIATILFALAYVHLNLALLDNISIPAWLAVAAAVSAVIGAMRGQLR